MTHCTPRSQGPVEVGNAGRGHTRCDVPEGESQTSLKRAPPAARGHGARTRVWGAPSWGGDSSRACPGPRFEHRLERPRPAGRWGLGGVATSSAGSCQLRGSCARCVQCVYSPVSWKDRRGRGKEVRLSGRHSSTCLSFLSEHNPWEEPGSPPAWPWDPCLSLGTPRAVQTEELRKGVREGVREGVRGGMG